MSEKKTGEHALQESITIDHAIGVLNRAVEVDHVAMEALVNTRVPCNAGLRDDPTIQVRGYDLPDGVDGLVGILGLLNGLFGIDEKGWGVIAANYAVDCPGECVVPNGKTICDACDECGSQLQLGRLIGFVRLDS